MPTAIVITLIWAGVVLALGGYVAWRVTRAIERRLQVPQKAAELAALKAEVALLDERITLKISEQTADEQVELRKAELRKRTAEVNAETTLVDELVDARRDAEARALIARGAAEEALAVDNLRALQVRQRGLPGYDLLAEYRKYLGGLPAGTSYYHLDSFLKIMRDAGYL
jgi:hypothetical protein